ncbi:MAG: FAD-dependent oxidoreductase [Candidatus Cyclonatronum sp.]|uniref:flavin monoamine oxidase family protein n=1 Tax=Cyclonatronum sp. TaxID=3024185 RepID=UPI0025C56853|nr:NAD(P)/FAD-dependent oxidoreductase [Cyclonatronum sp.]MCH8487179.1 FAD-dependent oxidoreductase [Cyclonatronum sp.]
MNPEKILKKLQKISFSENVIIIGAGAAGLYAGWLLDRLGVDYTILEASPVYGGRLAKLEGFADYPIDLGAQWLHGKKSLAGDWVKEQGAEIKADRSEEAYWFGGRLTKKPPLDTEIFEQEDLPDISFQELARERGLGPEFDGLITALAGDLGASPAKLSAYYNVLEFDSWKSGSTDYKFSETFFDLMERQLIPVVRNHIRLNRPVTEIDYSGRNILLTDASGERYKAGKVIITVPVTILQQDDIRFIPELPRSKRLAFSKIGMEPAIKIFMKFRERFYPGNTFGGEVCAAYIDEQYGKTGTTPVLLAYLMGGQASKLMALGSDEAMTEALIGELDLMFGGQASAHFEDAHVQNWTTHPWIRGGYSYSLCGMANARSVAAKPHAGCLYFAGEAMNTRGHHQSVHGALESGLQAVKMMIRRASPEP